MAMLPMKSSLWIPMLHLALFDGSPPCQFIKHNDFLWVNQNLSDFVSFPWQLNNPYYVPLPLAYVTAGLGLQTIIPLIGAIILLILLGPGLLAPFQQGVLTTKLLEDKEFHMLIYVHFSITHSLSDNEMLWNYSFWAK